LDIAIMAFAVGMLLLSSMNGNNSFRIFVFSALVLFIIVAGTYERIKKEEK
jgi:hypothetical protein